MKKYNSTGSLCLYGPFNLMYKIADLKYECFEDETYKYEIKPNYSTISLLDSKYFQGIPGINLELHKTVYIRENITPTLFQERIPSKNRDNYDEIISKLGLEFMDPILYLQRNKNYYSGDKFFISTYIEKENIDIKDLNLKCNTASYIRRILIELCKGNTVKVNNHVIDDKNREIVHDILLNIYSRSIERNKILQTEGIARAKIESKYKGRKPIKVNKLKFMELLKDVNDGIITSKMAAKELNISIDKFYRVRKSCLNHSN